MTGFLITLLFIAGGALVGLLLEPAADYLVRFAHTEPLPVKLPYLRPVTAGFSALTAGYLVLRFDLSPDLIAAAGSCTFILLITLIDLKYRLVLDALMLPAMLAVVGFHLLTGAGQPGGLAQMVVGGGLAFGIFALTALLKPGQLGGGDVKLAALIGLVFGFPGVLWALLIGAGAGAVFAVGMLASRRSLQTQIPYAPFLCAGALIALLYNPF